MRLGKSCVLIVCFLPASLAWPVFTQSGLPRTGRHFDFCGKFDNLKNAKREGGLIPFGLLEEDWDRLNLLRKRLPENSILKPKLSYAFCLLQNAVCQAYDTPYSNEDVGKLTECDSLIDIPLAIITKTPVLVNLNNNISMPFNIQADSDENQNFGNSSSSRGRYEEPDALDNIPEESVNYDKVYHSSRGTMVNTLPTNKVTDSMTKNSNNYLNSAEPSSFPRNYNEINYDIKLGDENPIMDPENIPESTIETEYQELSTSEVTSEHIITTTGVGNEERDTQATDEAPNNEQEPDTEPTAGGYEEFSTSTEITTSTMSEIQNEDEVITPSIAKEISDDVTTVSDYDSKQPASDITEATNSDPDYVSDGTSRIEYTTSNNSESPVDQESTGENWELDPSSKELPDDSQPTTEDNGAMTTINKEVSYDNTITEGPYYTNGDDSTTENVIVPSSTFLPEITDTPMNEKATDDEDIFPNPEDLPSSTVEDRQPTDTHFSSFPSSDISFSTSIISTEPTIPSEIKEGSQEIEISTEHSTSAATEPLTTMGTPSTTPDNPDYVTTYSSTPSTSFHDNSFDTTDSIQPKEISDDTTSSYLPPAGSTTLGTPSTTPDNPEYVTTYLSTPSTSFHDNSFDTTDSVQPKEIAVDTTSSYSPPVSSTSLGTPSTTPDNPEYVTTYLSTPSTYFHDNSFDTTDSIQPKEISDDTTSSYSPSVGSTTLEPLSTTPDNPEYVTTYSSTPSTSFHDSSFDTTDSIQPKELSDDNTSSYSPSVGSTTLGPLSTTPDKPDYFTTNLTPPTTSFHDSTFYTSGSIQPKENTDNITSPNSPSHISTTFENLSTTPGKPEYISTYSSTQTTPSHANSFETTDPIQPKDNADNITSSYSTSDSSTFVTYTTGPSTKSIIDIYNELVNNKSTNATLYPSQEFPVVTSNSIEPKENEDDITSIYSTTEYITRYTTINEPPTKSIVDLFHELVSNSSDGNSPKDTSENSFSTSGIPIEPKIIDDDDETNASYSPERLTSLASSTLVTTLEPTVNDEHTKDVSKGITTTESNKVTNDPTQLKTFRIKFPKELQQTSPNYPIKKLKIFPISKYPFRLLQRDSKSDCRSDNNCVRVHMTRDSKESEISGLNPIPEVEPEQSDKSPVADPNLHFSEWDRDRIIWLYKNKHLSNTHTG